MNATELLDQFVLEARECLETIGRRLLEVERDPANAELLNDLFRQVHTLKGNCGLFEFKALEHVVHAGEDLLDRVRHGQLAYDDQIADALLAAMDCSAEWIDAISDRGQLPAGAGERAQTLAAALRRHLQSIDTPVTAAVPTAATPAAPPDWLARVPAESCLPGRVALRYQPEPECFFKGEDPWHLARQAPGLLFLQVREAEPWPAPEVFDCYRCNLDIVLLSDAPRDALEAHFRYMPEQVQLWTCAPAVPRVNLLATRAAALWLEQCTVLARPAVVPGTVEAVRCVFLQLRHCLGEGGEVPETTDAASLLDWAREHAPAGAAPLAEIAPVAASSLATPAAMAPEPGAVSLEPRRGAPAADEHGSERGQKVLRVAQDKIDRLMELIGEMVVAKNALPYLAARAEEVFKQRELAREIKTQYAVINRIAEDMQHSIMQVRMLPVGAVFQRFGRLVRDISKKLGKEVQLVIEGEDTEADKNVIESLADPLIHILRNSLDHGLERPELRLAAGKPAVGTLKVSARQEADRVVLTISDDGAGIDTDRVRAKAVERDLIDAERAAALSEHEAAQLVFLPGFSTADTISDLSGRGVGMDVVRTAVERVNGSVELSSVRGQGTTIRLSLPLSMAVTHVMMIEAAGRRFGVPMDMIVETVRVPAEDIHHFKRSRTVVLRGRVVPLCTLHELLSLDSEPVLNSDGEHAVLVVRLGHENIGLLVDDFQGTSDIILKPMEGVLSGLTGFAGTALMGDGSVLMVLDPKELI